MDLIEIMFNEERLTKNSIFSKKTRAANFLLKFALVGLCLAFISCANIFQDKVAMSRSGASATLGDIFVSGATAGKLDTPSQINVTQYEYKDKIRVSWSPVKNASYYNLKRAVVEKDDDGNWKKMKDDDSLDWKDIGRIHGTSYTDTIITDNWNDNDALDYKNEKYKNAYYYSVSAGNSLLGYDDSEEEKSTWGALLTAPERVKASMGSSKEYIKITWKGVEGARKYKIYRSLQKDGKNSTPINTLDYFQTSYQDNEASSFIDKPSQNLFYTICSVGANGEESVSSSVAMGYMSSSDSPPQVDNVIVTTAPGEYKDSIEIKWDTVDGDNVFYNVYRTSSEDYEPIRLNDDGISVEGNSGTYKDSGDKAKFKQNIYYYYYVQSYKKKMDNGEEVIYLAANSLSGPASDDEGNSSYKYAEGFILSAPSSVEVQKPNIEQKNDPYTILFTPSIGDEKFAMGEKGEKYTNKYEYVVYGGDSENGSFTKVETSSLVFDEDKGKYSIKIPQYKFYKMQVKNAAGKESEETATVAPAPYAPTDVYVTCAALVGDYSNYQSNSITAETDPGSNDNGVHPVKIVWTAPEGDDAAYYNIYRKENIDGGWGTPINTEPVTETCYIDKNENAKIGTIYYYSVISLNSLKQGAKRSTFIEPTVGENGVIKTTDVVIDGKSTRCGRGWGWGALSAWQYMREERKTIESSHKKLTYMNKPNNLDKMGTETKLGDISGSVYYNAGMSAYVTMTYTNYADFYINGNKSLGIYFLFNGNTNTNANMSANGHMEKTLDCDGMYPGSVIYDNVQIKGGAARGGTYGVIRNGIDSSAVQVDWTAGDK
ncbi:MAG: hypothetical protein K2I95_05080 [Treponemataceae bacterium]|nr:hypothetical protein [Treponemataceae bacterium]